MKLIQWAIVILLALSAFLTRISPIVVLGHDEALLWRTRSEIFLEALESGHLEDTDPAYHPGVVTLWLGAAGVALNRGIHGEGFYDIDSLSYFALLRLPIAIFHAIGIAIAYLLLRRLLNTPLALLTSIFWLLSPFVLAQSQIVHTDAPVMLLAILTLLMTMIAVGLDVRYPEETKKVIVRWGWWVGAGICFGLATLAKLNGVLVIGAVGLFLLVRHRYQWRDLRWWLDYIRSMFVFGIIAVATFVVVFPAMWVEPITTFGGMFIRANDLAQDGHLQFFFGEVSLDPGLLFYFVTTIFRVTPLVTLGLVLFPIALLRAEATQYRQVLIGFAIYVLVFIGITSVEPKKFDRYILPIFPALYLFAAVGYFGLALTVRNFLKTRVGSKTLDGLEIAALILFCALLTTQITDSYPYMISYYNPLLGGARGASEVLMVGWGEGLDQASDFIDEESQGNCRYIISDISHVSQEYTECRVLEVSACALAAVADNPEDSYVVRYFNYTQRNLNPVIQAAIEGVEPIQVVQIGGVNMAQVYRAEDIHLEIFGEAGSGCNS